MIAFDANEMVYLVYQEEISESGTYHFQGYCEFKKRCRKNKAKELLGGRTVHVEKRRGTQEQASEYCKREFNEDGSDKRIPLTVPFEEGVPRPDEQGKRVDLIAFKDAVMAGANQRDLLDEHVAIIARYPKFYATLTMLHRPERRSDLTVTLLIGETGLGKTRMVVERFKGDDGFFQCPVSNGTVWFDGYDGHTKVLIDDFAGAASHVQLSFVLQLLDRYPVQMPVKGSHCWWMPNEVFVTTNILPRYWYKWENRGGQYKALARRFHFVYLYHVPMSAADCGYELADADWWKDHAPPETEYN